MKNPIAKLFTVTALLGAPSLAHAYVRTLPSGAPACGNVMGKGIDEAKERACTKAEIKEWEAERAELARRGQVAAKEAAKEAAREAARKAAKQALAAKRAAPASTPEASAPRAAARTTGRGTR